MGKRKRHNPFEVASKLEQARLLAGQGMIHSEIAKILGVSVMTFHRWRKGMSFNGAVKVSPQEVKVSPQELMAAPLTSAPVEESGERARISELLIENGRLRKLVTDLLLEKMRLEDQVMDKPLFGSSVHKAM